MCDFSLEMYRSRPARAGERYETQRFPSGSVGLTSPGDHSTAVCLACDTRLKLENIPRDVQQRVGSKDVAEVTFVRIDEGPYHDGVQFANGSVLTLQQLGVGVGISLADEPATVAPLKKSPEVATV